MDLVGENKLVNGIDEIDSVIFWEEEIGEEVVKNNQTKEDER